MIVSSGFGIDGGGGMTFVGDGGSGTLVDSTGCLDGMDR